MQRETKRVPTAEIESLNRSLGEIDLLDLEVEEVEQRLELTVAVLLAGIELQQDHGCGTLTCTSFQGSA